MNEDERWTEVCLPKLGEMQKALDVIQKHLIIGNGKPSLLNRVDTLEKCIEAINRYIDKVQSTPKDNRSLSIGKFIVLKGYGANDVVRIVIVCGVLWLVFEPYVSKFIK